LRSDAGISSENLMCFLWVIDMKQSGI